MPFKSDKQRRFLYSQKPEVAKKFAEHKAMGGPLAEYYSFGDFVKRSLGLEDAAKAGRAQKAAAKVVDDAYWPNGKPKATHWKNGKPKSDKQMAYEKRVEESNAALANDPLMQFALDLAPGIGEYRDAMRVVDDAVKGNFGGAAANAALGLLGIIPGGDIAKQVAKTGLTGPLTKGWWAGKKTQGAGKDIASDVGAQNLDEVSYLASKDKSGPLVKVRDKSEGIGQDLYVDPKQPYTFVDVKGPKTKEAGHKSVLNQLDPNVGTKPGAKQRSGKPTMESYILDSANPNKAEAAKSGTIGDSLRAQGVWPSTDAALDNLPVNSSRGFINQDNAQIVDRLVNQGVGKAEIAKRTGIPYDKIDTLLKYRGNYKEGGTVWDYIWKNDNMKNKKGRWSKLKDKKEK